MFLFFIGLNLSFAQTRDPNSFINHKVKKTETLQSLSEIYQISENEILLYNPLVKKIGLKKRMSLKIPNFKSKNKPIDTIKYRIYIIQAKENKWRLAYENNTTIRVIDSLNPEIINGLKIGQKIIIPRSEITLVIPKKDSLFNYYKVLPKEGYYRIEKKLGISKIKLDSLNPQLIKNGLQEGMILKIPAKNSGTLMIKEDLLVERINLLDSISESRKIKLAILLPFKANQIILDSIEETKSLLLSRNLHTISLDFLSGIKLAAKTVSERGISVELSVFDTKNDILRIQDIVSFNNLNYNDAIIGPLVTSNFDYLSSKKELIDTPKISPLSSNKVIMRKNVYQTLTQKNFLRNKMYEYLETKLDSTQNIVLVVDSLNRNIEIELKKRFPSSILMRPEKKDYLLPELVDSLLVDSIPNKIILESESFPLIASVISQMNAQNSLERNVQLYTTYRGNEYETKNLSYKVMGGIKFTYPAGQKKSSQESLTSFHKNYIILYGKPPNKESTRAYDLTLDIILRIAFKGKLNNSLSIGETEYIENRFLYYTLDNESYINEAFYILQHSNYELLEIKDWDNKALISY